MGPPTLASTQDRTLSAGVTFEFRQIVNFDLGRNAI
jgi:hypothetical protein